MARMAVKTRQKQSTAKACSLKRCAEVDVPVFGIHFMSPFAFQRLSVWDVAYGLALALASVMAYEASSVVIPLFLHTPADAPRS